MHKTSFRSLRLAVLALAATCLCGLSAPAGAGPIVLQDTKPPANTMIDTSELVTLEHDDNIPNWDKPPVPSGPTQASTKPGDVALAPASAPAKPALPAPPAAGASSQPSQSQDLRNNVKESVRPVYDQLLESGAIEALHDVKESLGLNKDAWNDQDRPAGAAKASSPWDAPDGALPARTTAQAQMDRELADMMRAKLIDQLTPWVAGLLGLYLLGFVIKLLFGYVRWKSARRNERIIKRAKRQAAHRSHRTSARTAPSPRGTTVSPSTTNESTESF
jgi:hypothetical protein